jgi:hypothetical protein
MPTIQNVALDIEPIDDKVLRATIRLDVRMSALEECIADRCLRGLNEEYRVNTTIYPVDFGIVGDRYLLVVGSADVVWDAAPVASFSFSRTVPRGADLDEDWGKDELRPHAEIRTRSGGVVVTTGWGPIVEGFF